MMMKAMMNNNKISTSLILLFATPFVVFVNANIAQQCIDNNCFDTIDSSQECLRMCSTENPIPVTNGYWNLLQQCTDNDYNAASTADFSTLVECCGMDGTSNVDGVDTTVPSFTNSGCDTTMSAAQSCARIDGCIDPCIVDKAKKYMTCVKEKKASNECPFSDICMGRLFNDVQLDDNNQPTNIRSIDFNDVLESAATNAIAGSTCSPFGPFVETVCYDIGSRCCAACEAELGELTECLINNFVLPVIEAQESSTTGLQCSFNTSVGGCGLTTFEGLTTPGSTTSGNAPAPASSPDGIRRNLNDNDDDEIDMSECETVLGNNWLLYNASYAAGEFMNCNTKTLATIIVASDEQESSSAMSSGSSNVGSSGRWMVVKFLLGVVATTAATILAV